MIHLRVAALDPSTAARAGTLVTRRGEIPTPVFMPVGTQATVRAQGWDGVRASGSRILLANTFHLMLRPGVEVFERFGGIHAFMGWEGAVLTDSGGYQVFSLSERLRLDEGGARFSLPGGREVALTPEKSIAVQQSIGSDIMMAFDQCLPSTSPREAARDAMERTHRWALRSLKAREPESPQALFGIVQGACFADLRRESAAEIGAMAFDGYAIGGLAVGETRAERRDMTELVAGLLPPQKPRYLMGVGTPVDLLEAVARGVDMFDCILPTAFAQQGLAFTSRGKVDLRRGVYRLSEEPLDPGCACPTCARHPRAYLHHLIKAREILGWQLTGLHNLHFYHALMREARSRIVDGTFGAWVGGKIASLERGDEDNPVAPPRRGRTRQAPLAIGAYEIVDAPSGYSSVRHAASGETMHSVVDPEAEARALYVEQPGLEARLARGEDVVVWDVGLGAATNAMAAVRCREALGSEAGRLTIVSFENDLDSLRLALRHPGRFKHLRHGAPVAVLKNGAWSGEAIEWRLLEGNFLQRLEDAPSPDLVYYDPFSFKTDSPLWTPEAFARVRAAIGARPVRLLTYSASTAARAAMMSAGFWVARGRGTGPKAETTVALTPEAVLSDGAGAWELLGAEWLSRWERSGARRPELDALVFGHAQFRVGASAESR